MPPKLSCTTAFTLVEMLVSITILSIMLLSLASMMGFVARAWISGVGTVDNYNKARAAMSVLDRDIQMMILRRDLPAFVDSTGASPACQFYTNVEGNPGSNAPDTRTISLVQYLLTTTPTSSILQRQNWGMSYPSTSGTGTVSTTGTPTLSTFNTGTSGLVAPAAASLQTDTVATGVIAFGIQYIDGTGTVQTPSSSNLFKYDFVYPGDPTNDHVVVVSMVVMNNAAYNLAILTGNLTKVTSCFTPTPPTAPTTPSQTYSQAWNGNLNSPNATFLALPLQIRSGIKVYERRIPIPVTTPSA